MKTKRSQMVLYDWDHAYLSQVLLHKLRAHHSDESSCGVMCNSLGKHGLPSARSTIQQHPPGWVNANLSVQLMVRQRKLHCLLDLLLLNVVASNILPTTITQFVTCLRSDLQSPQGRRDVYLYCNTAASIPKSLCCNTSKAVN